MKGFQNFRLGVLCLAILIGLAATGEAQERPVSVQGNLTCGQGVGVAR